MNLLDALFKSDCNTAIVSDLSMLIIGSGHSFYEGEIEPLEETLGELSETLKEDNVECRPIMRG